MRPLVRIGVLLVLALLVVGAGATAVMYQGVVRRNVGPPPPVCAASPAPRGAWSAPVVLSRPPGRDRYAIEPAAALLPDGTLAIAYNVRGGLFDPSSIALATVAPDGAVREATLATDRSQQFDLWMDADGAGRLHLVWLGHDGGRPDKRVVVGYATSADGLTWSPPRAVHDAAQDCPGERRGCMDKPMVAVGRDPARPGSQAVRVFYYSEVTSSLRMVRAELALGLDVEASFGPSVRAAGGTYGDARVAPGGALHLVDVAGEEAVGVDLYGDQRLRVEYARSDDGLGFGSPVTVSAPGELVPFYFSNPQVVADEARGLLYVVYPAGAGHRWDLQLATSRDGGRTWSRTRLNDDAPCAVHMTPRAALDPRTGALHVTWLDNRGGGELVAAICDAGGERCGPATRVSDAPFASFRFARHQPDWLGEYGALVLDPRRRVLHAVWAQPVASGAGPPTSLIHLATLPLPADPR